MTQKMEMVALLSSMGVGLGMSRDLQDAYVLEIADAITDKFNFRTAGDEQALRKLEELESGGVDNWSWYDEIDWNYIETGERA